MMLWLVEVLGLLLLLVEFSMKMTDVRAAFHPFTAVHARLYCSAALKRPMPGDVAGPLTGSCAFPPWCSPMARLGAFAGLL